jgi:hypothetical protein
VHELSSDSAQDIIRDSGGYNKIQEDIIRDLGGYNKIQEDIIRFRRI